MLRTFIALFVLSLLPVIVRAQPALFEPSQNYYKARGTKVTPTWSVDRKSLTENDAIIATLTIQGSDNPHEVIRPDLAKIRAYADRFQIENLPSPPDVKGLTFVYKLRPRNTSVDRLPTLEFWYDSGIKFGDPFKKAIAKGIDLVVTAVPKPKPQVVPMLEPDGLFQLEADSLRREPFSANGMSWLALFAVGIVGSLGWYLVWRRIYPDGARLAKLRRNRAMRRATDALQRADRSSDPAGAVAAAVLGYLRTRFPLPAGSETPSEVSEVLRLAGSSEADAVAAFLRRCDAARFSPSSDNPVSLAEDARSLLAKLEAE